VVHAELRRHLVRRNRIAPAARIKKHPAKLGIAGRCEAIERHSGEKLPASQRELARREPDRADGFLVRFGNREQRRIG